MQFSTLQNINPDAILEILVKILVIAIFVRIIWRYLPAWLLGVFALLFLFSSGILDPSLLSTVQTQTTGLVQLLAPFLVIAVVLGVIMRGMKGR